MASTGISAPASKAVLWAGRTLSVLGAVFMLFDTVIHIAHPAPVVEAFLRLGFPVSLALPIAIVEAVCLVAYVTPPTAVLGAILLTGYLGGATAVNLLSIPDTLVRRTDRGRSVPARNR